MGDGLLARRLGAAKLSIWVVLVLQSPTTAMLDIPIGSKDGPSTKRHGAANIKAVGAQQHPAPLHKYRWYLDFDVRHLPAATEGANFRVNIAHHMYAQDKVTWVGFETLHAAPWHVPSRCIS